jgi:hypothetical protein
VEVGEGGTLCALTWTQSVQDNILQMEKLSRYQRRIGHAFFQQAVQKKDDTAGVATAAG